MPFLKRQIHVRCGDRLNILSWWHHERIEWLLVHEEDLRMWQLWRIFSLRKLWWNSTVRLSRETLWWRNTGEWHFVCTIHLNLSREKNVHKNLVHSNENCDDWMKLQHKLWLHNENFTGSVVALKALRNQLSMIKCAHFQISQSHDTHTYKWTISYVNRFSVTQTIAVALAVYVYSLASIAATWQPNIWRNNAISM